MTDNIKSLTAHTWLGAVIFFLTKKIREAKAEVKNPIIPCIWSLGHGLISSSVKAICKWWGGCFMGLATSISIVCSNRCIWPKSFSFFENTFLCLRRRPHICAHWNSVLPSALHLCSSVWCSGSGVNGYWIFKCINFSASLSPFWFYVVMWTSLSAEPFLLQSNYLSH